MGEREIICKQHQIKMNCSYGTIFPVEPELKAENIIEQIRPSGNVINEVIEVKSLKRKIKKKEAKSRKIVTNKIIKIYFQRSLTG